MVALWVAVALCPVASAQRQFEVAWEALPSTLGDRVVSTVLVDGTELKGRVLGVSPTELRFQVNRTSKPVFYPKGEVTIPRDQLGAFGYYERRGSLWRKVGTAGGAGGGFLVGLPILLIANNEGGQNNLTVGIAAAATGAGAGLGFLLGREADTKRIVVVIADD